MKLKKTIWNKPQEFTEGLNALNMVLLCYINEASLCLFSSLMIGCGIVNRRPWAEWAEYKQFPSDILFDIVEGRGGRWL